jgi:hypothetical protein
VNPEDRILYPPILLFGSDSLIALWVVSSSKSGASSFE